MINTLVELIINSKKIKLNNIQDFRNYKVSIQNAKLTLGFTPVYGIKNIIDDLYQNIDKFQNFEDEKYYNIKIFKSLGK